MASHVRVDRLSRVFPSVSDRSCAMLSGAGSTCKAVVFVHGFAGAPMSTWAQFHDVRLLSDEAWSDADLFFIGYDSARLDLRSATWIVLDFLRRLVPNPPPELFTSTFRNRTLSVRDTVESYRDLYLVGHSLGGVVVRDAVRLGLRDLIRDLPDGREGGDAAALFGPGTVEAHLANAELRLFAPAIGGVRPGGLLGVLNALGLSAAVAWSRSKHELDSGSIMLAEIRRETEEFHDRFPKLTGLSARIAWAGRDNVVSPVEYRCDRTGAQVQSATHKSICKPTLKFLLPVAFVGIGGDH